MGKLPPQPLTPVAPGTSIAEVLRNPPLDPLEARILLSQALRFSHVQLITRSDHRLTVAEAASVTQLFSRRAAGEPIAYIVGEREFFGLPLCTTPDVLIPRPETELLVELALERLPAGARAIDLGTGSGAIAIAMAHARADVDVTALDASGAALAVAERNAERHRLTIRFLQSDWYGALSDERFDLIASNPPYIVAGDPHLSEGDLRYEPLDALTDHGDGLEALRAIIAGAPAHLRPGGWLLVEHGYDQAGRVRELMTARGLHDSQSWRDLAGIERVTGAHL